MLILGLDPSQKAGYALYDPSEPLSAMRCGTLRIDASKGDFEGNAGLLGRALVGVLRERRNPQTGKPILPDFAVVEAAPRQPAGFFRKGGGKPTVKFMGQEMVTQDGDTEAPIGGGLQSTLSTNQMAAALCAILGAYKIPFETMRDSEWRKAAFGFGKRAGWSRPDWKRHARQMCAQSKIVATNDDMAEACWIAFAGAGCQRFKMLARAA